MFVTSLPLLLFLIVPVTLLALVTPAKASAVILALGGCAYLLCTGGVRLLLLTILSAAGAWLSSRRKGRVRRILCAASEAAVLLGGAFLLPQARDRVTLIFFALTAFVCCAEDSPSLGRLLGHLFCMPRVQVRALAPCVTEKTARRKRVNFYALAQGAQRCVLGLSETVLLAVPMNALLEDLNALPGRRTAVECALMLAAFYFSVFFSLRGALRVGGGILRMLGFSDAESCRPLRAAPSLHGFLRQMAPSFTRFWRGALPKPSSRLLESLLSTVFLGALGGVAAGSLNGVLWGVFLSLALALETFLGYERLRALPSPLRIFCTGFVLLFSCGFLCRAGVGESFSFYAALFGAGGFAPGPAALYLIRTRLPALILSTAAALPIWHRKRPREHDSAARLLIPVVEFGLLLCCFGELLSGFLRG